MRLHLDTDPRQWRRFTLTTLGAPTLLMSLLAWRRVIPGRLYLAFLALIAAVAIAAWTRPHWFGGFYRTGMKVAFRIGQGLGFVLLNLVFLLIVIPLGLVLRVLGYDPLRLRRHSGSDTYWEQAQPPGPLERMF
jgi:hypothetical protein